MKIESRRLLLYPISDEEMTILIENEKQANHVAAKVMRITFLIFTFIYILDLIGIFVINLAIMTIAYIGSGILLMLPTLLVDIFKRDNVYIKYITFK